MSLSGAAAGSYSTVHSFLSDSSAEWHGLEGSAVTIADRVRSVASTALGYLRYLVERLQSVLDVADLHPVQRASYSDGSGTDDQLTSYAEYRVALTVEQALVQAGDIVERARRDLAADVPPLELEVPVFPFPPTDVPPPGVTPMPQRERHPTGIESV